MTAFSNYLENKILEHTLKGATNPYTPPTTIYIGLFTSSLGETGGGNEISTSGSAYARQSVAFGTVTSGSVSNSNTILFSTATSNWGTITQIGLFDAATGGNLLYYGSVVTSKTVSIGDTFSISPGNLTITLD